MSIYGPKIRIPSFRLPKISIPKPEVSFKGISLILIIILIIATIAFLFSTPISFNNHIGVYWVNNPLDLREETNAELHLSIINTGETTQNISLSVTTESNELIIFCPDKEFPNVASQNKRETTCIIRRNPNTKIFSGTYLINIQTNIGSAQTSIEIRK
jgi:uncharacterized membrane protein